MRLYIVRHGEAERQAPTDAERALTDFGRRQVDALWRSLAEEGVCASAIISSPFRRAVETADVIAGLFPGCPRETLDGLTPEASPAALVEWLMDRGDAEGVVLVSHMPLVAQLTGLLVEGPGSRVPFSTGATACLELEVAAAAGGRLLWLRAPEAGPAAPP